MWDPEAVANWLGVRGIVTNQTAGRALGPPQADAPTREPTIPADVAQTDAAPPQQPPATPVDSPAPQARPDCSPSIDPETMRQPGLRGCLERYRMREMIQAATLQEMSVRNRRASQAGESLQYSQGEIAQATRLLNQTAKELRSLELAVARWEREMGGMVDFDEVAACFRRCATATRQSVLATGNALVALLKPYLRDDEAVVHVARILDENLALALSVLAEDLPYAPE